MTDDCNKENGTNNMHDDNFKYKAAAFITGVTGLSLLGGFGMTLNLTKKQDPDMFTKGLVNSSKGPAMESGSSLALRALARGTLYSVSGFAIFCYGVWKLMGVNSMSEFRTKVGGMMPAVHRNDPPQSRTEFDGIRDLFQYLVDEDEKTHVPSDKT